ncbi:MAG: glycosyltransferase WbuB [Planctomycetes bacterium]|nr:glycosyltransferase WbuB [Planctomycetota bacterium]NOG55027.1 glycosyltransferase family 4 protein [Planctomycetota bacterium]
MRVLLLNQTFYPDVAATAQHGTDLARHLVAQGHQVVAVSSRSIYGRKGAALDAYENVDGIEIHRVGFSLFGKSSGILGRLIDFVLWYILAGWKVLTLPTCDVCIAFTTPPFVALIGLLMRWAYGTKLIYWAMDLYPDVPVLYGMMKPNAWLTRVLERIHRSILRRADRTIALGRCMRDRLVAKGIDPHRITIVNVWADRNEVTPAGSDGASNPYRTEWGLTDRFIVMYSGNFGMMHDAATFVEAARLLNDQPHDSSIEFLFVGAGARTDEVKQQAESYGLTNVRFEPYQPRERLNDLLTLGDVHLISMIEGAQGLIVPCKLFGILAAGRPVLFVGPPESEIGRVVNEEDCGWVVPIGEASRLVDHIRRLAADVELAAQMGGNGRTALEQRYDRSIACASIERMIREVVTGTKRSCGGNGDGVGKQQERSQTGTEHTVHDEARPNGSDEAMCQSVGGEAA